MSDYPWFQNFTTAEEAYEAARGYEEWLATQETTNPNGYSQAETATNNVENDFLF